jgi:hypothetical protein
MTFVNQFDCHSHVRNTGVDQQQDVRIIWALGERVERWLLAEVIHPRPNHDESTAPRYRLLVHDIH